MAGKRSPATPAASANRVSSATRAGPEDPARPAPGVGHGTEPGRRRLAGRVALVTGSSRGIGAAIARAFVAEGARVAVTWHRSEAPARALAAELDEALCVPLDVTDPASVRAAFAAVLGRWDRLDLLVNNAGLLQQKPFLEISAADWDATLAVNLKGPFLCTQEAARIFERQRRDAGAGTWPAASGLGSADRSATGNPGDAAASTPAPPAAAIVNVSSVGAQLGGPRAPHYAAAKAALLAFTKSTARLLAPHVRVNAVAPGFVRTDMYEHILASTDESSILRQIPLARVATPAEIAAATAFLASDEASFVTGHALNANGGQWMG